MICFVITDEIYEYITYDDYAHVSLASLKDYSERTITISGFSKIYHMTGWRLGYGSGPAEIMTQIRLSARFNLYLPEYAFAICPDSGTDIARALLSN